MFHTGSVIFASNRLMPKTPLSDMFPSVMPQFHMDGSIVRPKKKTNSIQVISVGVLLSVSVIPAAVLLTSWGMAFSLVSQQMFFQQNYKLRRYTLAAESGAQCCNQNYRNAVKVSCPIFCPKGRGILEEAFLISDSL